LKFLLLRLLVLPFQLHCHEQDVGVLARERSAKVVASSSMCVSLSTAARISRCTT
jgi:hypothetical protein